MERSYLVSHYHLSFTHPFNQVDIAVLVELLSIFMKELRLRIWTQGLSSPYETLISTPKGLSPLLREMIRLYFLSLPSFTNQLINLVLIIHVLFLCFP